MNFFRKTPKTFFPATDIPSLSGKVIIVTGGNQGLGKTCITHLARHNPARIYLGARSASKAEDAITQIRAEVPGAVVEHLQLDLANLGSVRDAARSVLEKEKRLDILMNNAGIMCLPHAVTADGFELTFGTNHLGPELLTQLLLPLMHKTAAGGADVRVVNLTSVAHNFSVSGGLQLEKCTTDMKDTNNFWLYGQSKLANVLYTKELAKRNPEICIVAVHPGRVGTEVTTKYYEEKTWITWVQQNVIDRMTVTSIEEGVKNQLWAATGKKEEVVSGTYYEPIAVAGKDSKLAKNAQLQSKLWDWTQEQFVRLGYLV